MYLLPKAARLPKQRRRARKENALCSTFACNAACCSDRTDSSVPAHSAAASAGKLHSTVTATAAHSSASARSTSTASDTALQTGSANCHYATGASSATAAKDGARQNASPSASSASNAARESARPRTVTPGGRRAAIARRYSTKCRCRVAEQSR